MPKQAKEYTGNLKTFLHLKPEGNSTESPGRRGIFIPFANAILSDFNIMVVGSRPSNGRTLFLNELLIANTIFRPGDPLISSPPLRALAYFLTENPVNYFNKFIPGILGVKQEILKWNKNFRGSEGFLSEIEMLENNLSLRPLFLEFTLPSEIDEFIAALESDIQASKPDFIFIDGLESLAQPERLEYEYHGTRNIDLWLDACLGLNKKYSIPFIITRLLNPQNDRTADVFQPVFSDFNSSTIDSGCDIVLSIMRTAFYGGFYSSDMEQPDKTLQFLIHRDRTGTLKGKYLSEIDSEIPRIIFPEKGCF